LLQAVEGQAAELGFDEVWGDAELMDNVMNVENIK